MEPPEAPLIGAPIAGVFAREAPRLRRYFRARGFRDDAEDMVQECFRRVAGRSADHPEAFLMRVAVNLAIEHWRASGRRQHVSLEDFDLAGPDPLAQIEAADLLRRIEASLASLGPKTRAIFLQHRVDGLTYPELAARHGLSLHGVEYHMAKAIGFLRRHYGDRR